MPLDRAERRLRSQAAAYTMHGRGLTNTEPARRAFEQKFHDLADPTGTLPEHERARRAEQLRRAHFAALSLKAAKAKRQAKAGTSTVQ